MREIKPQFIPGDHYMVCDSCGMKFRRSEITKRWDGMYVCKADWEPRHQQESVSVRVDRVRVPVARPEPFSAGTELLDGTELDGETVLDFGSYITTPVTQDDL